MNRRAFIAGLAGTALWSPPALFAQQQAAPTVGLLSSVPFNTRRDQLDGFRRGLAEAGFVEGQTLTIEYRSAENRTDRLPSLAAELVDRRVDVIVTIGGDISAGAAKSATTTIPVVFVTGFDPVQSGFVASLNRPGGNITGVNFLVVITVAKRLELLSELVPAAVRIGMLVNPINPNAAMSRRDGQSAADSLSKKLLVVEGSTEHDIDAAFATLAREEAEALLVEADPFLLARREQIVALAARHKFPSLYAFREFAIIGGLMSYGASLANAYREAGIYAAKILRGEKPGELPVTQASKFELVLNLQTAKTLGLNVPLTLQVAADEVIE
ncbi:MAG: ABC transporter substrate-binding protein [Xanthobacteraceae bacterium]